MNTFPLQAIQLSVLLENAYIAFLRNAPSPILTRVASRPCMAFRIVWTGKDAVTIVGNLRIEIVETLGTYEKAVWDDWEPDIGLADYVPDRSVATEPSIDEYLGIWHLALPSVLNSTQEQTGASPAQRLNNLITKMPALRHLVLATLEGRIDQEFRMKLLEISEAWLYGQSAVRC